MATARLGPLLRHIHKLAGEPPGSPRKLGDGELLDAFATRRDQAAFAALVDRHGAMVLRVCRRVLGHEQDAEDAFQATFLVLARHSRAIRRQQALAGWLHGVAFRTAMKAKRTAARQRNHEARFAARSPRFDSPRWDDVQAVLDEEIERLPDAYRTAFVLCVLEGKTWLEAAAAMGIKGRTVLSRVLRARRMLQARLTRRGIKLATLLAALSVAESACSASVPAALVNNAIRFGLLVAAGESAAGVIPSHIAALAAGVTRAMFVTKMKIAIAIALAVGLVGIGAPMARTGVLMFASGEEAQPDTPLTRQTPETQQPKKNKAPAAKESDPPPAVLDPNDPLDATLLRWQKAIDKVEVASCKISRTDKDNQLKYVQVLEGTFKYAKPKRWVLELERKDKPELREKWRRNGQALQQFDFHRKEVIEHETPADSVLQSGLDDTFFGRACRYLFFDSSLIGFLVGMKAENAKRHYALNLTKGKEHDPYYVYIDIKPRRKSDEADFETARLVLNKKTHLPRQFWFRQPNGDETTWDIPELQTGVELSDDDFKLAVPAGWRLKKVPKLPRDGSDTGAKDQKDK